MTPFLDFFKSFESWKKTFIALLLISLALGIPFALPIYRKLKLWRSLQLVGKAEQLYSEQQWEGALQNSQASLQLSPGNERAVRIIAQLYSLADQNRATLYWQRLLDHPKATDRDRINAAQFFVRIGRPELARPTLEKLTGPSLTGEVALLAADYWNALNDQQETLLWLQKASDLQPDRAAPKLALARALLRQSETRTEGKSRLALLLRLTESEALDAARDLLAQPDLNPVLREQAIHVLELHPRTSFECKLVALEHRIRQAPSMRAKIIDEILGRYDATKKTDTEALARWLNRIGEWSKTESLLKKLPETRSHEALLLIYSDALAALGKWADLKSLFASDFLPMDPMAVELFRARIAMKLQDDRAAESHWRRAANLAGYDPSKLIYAADYARKAGATDVSTQLYTTLTRFPSYAINAYRTMIIMSDRPDNEQETLRLLGDLSKLLPDDPAPQIDQLYLRAILRLLQPHDIEKLQQLASRHPGNISIRFTQALISLQQHKPEEASLYLKEISASAIHAIPAWQAIYAATLAATGKKAEAKTLISSIPLSVLRKEELALIEEYGPRKK